MTTLRLVRDRTPVELPKVWEDGRAVQWAPWSPPLRFFICPPPPLEDQACAGCGEIAQEETSTGKLMPLPGETYEDEEIVQSKRQPGASWLRVVRRPVRPMIRLVAFRCVACGHVEIVDPHDGGEAN